MTVSLTVPPAPLQVSVNWLSVAIEAMVSDPDAFLLPDQSPVAVQLVTSVVIQLIVVEPFWDTVPRLAPNESVGAGTGGAATVTLTESLALPPSPLQVMV